MLEPDRRSWRLNIIQLINLKNVNHFPPFTSSCISYKNYGRMSKKLTYHFSSRPPLNFSSLFLLYPEEAWLLYFVIQFVWESIRQSRVFQYSLLYIYLGSYTRLSCSLIRWNLKRAKITISLSPILYPILSYPTGSMN